MKSSDIKKPGWMNWSLALNWLLIVAFVVHPVLLDPCRDWVEKLFMGTLIVFSISFLVGYAFGAGEAHANIEALSTLNEDRAWVKVFVKQKTGMDLFDE